MKIAKRLVKEEGIALVAVMLALFVLALLSAALLNLSAASFSGSMDQEYKQKALNLAEAGLVRALGTMSTVEKTYMEDGSYQVPSVIDSAYMTVIGQAGAGRVQWQANLDVAVDRGFTVNTWTYQIMAGKDIDINTSSTIAASTIILYGGGSGKKNGAAAFTRVPELYIPKIVENGPLSFPDPNTVDSGDIYTDPRLSAETRNCKYKYDLANLKKGKNMLAFDGSVLLYGTSPMGAYGVIKAEDIILGPATLTNLKTYPTAVVSLGRKSTGTECYNSFVIISDKDIRICAPSSVSGFLYANQNIISTAAT
ncbi:MAG TPA: hypothetical protein VHS59_12965, partial [Bacillota bacterium]|nr:hypothetical protein [Bacillota bacterium]